MIRLAPFTRALTRADYLDDAALAPERKPAPGRQTALHHLLAAQPHLVSHARLLALPAPASSGSSSASSASSPASTLPTLPTASSVAEIEGKLAAALLACRAALEDVASSDESDSEDDMSEDDDDEEEDDDDMDEEDDEDDEDEDDDEPLPAPKPDDSFARRMRRIHAWRAGVWSDAAAAAPPRPSASLKRKASFAAEPDCAAAKRARTGAACAACERTFECRLALVQHAASEACRAAVAYQLEA